MTIFDNDYEPALKISDFGWCQFSSATAHEGTSDKWA